MSGTRVSLPYHHKRSCYAPAAAHKMVATDGDHPVLPQICIGTIEISKELKTINIASSVPILSSSLQNLLPLLFCEPSASSSGIFSLSLRSLSSLCSVFHGLFSTYTTLSSFVIFLLCSCRQHETNKEVQ